MVVVPESSMPYLGGAAATRHPAQMPGQRGSYSVCSLTADLFQG